MKPPRLDETNESCSGRKVYDQTIYVTALERGTRDRSPRPVEPLPDRIELKISPQKNHRGRMKFYRASSIPELCRITLTPTGETSFEQNRMEEVYITQYTHSFDREIEKPHIVAWKLGFEGSDVAHRDSKLCIVNSPVGSKAGGYPERRRSAPPGSFVFNYDALDIPESTHRRSNSLGLYMNDFNKMDSLLGANAGGSVDTKGGSSGGDFRPLAHEMISAEKVEQVESVYSSFWDDAFDSFDSGNNYNNLTNSDVRNNGINDVTNGDVTTKETMVDDVMTDDAKTSYVRSDVKSDYVMKNDFNTRYDQISTQHRDSREDSTQDPTKQALSLLSTLRSTVKKPDSETFLRSVHETETSKTFPTSSKNHPSMKSKETTSQEVSSRYKVPHGTIPRESPQKVTPRIVGNPRSDFTSEIIPRKSVPQEDLPQDMGPQLNSKYDLEIKLKRRYKSKAEDSKMIPDTSKLDPTSQRPRDSDAKIKRKYETNSRSEKLVKITSHSASELSTINQSRFQTSVRKNGTNPQVDSMYSFQSNNEGKGKPPRQFTTEVNAVSPKKTGLEAEEEPRGGMIETDKKYEANSEMNQMFSKTDVCYTHSKPGVIDDIDGQARSDNPVVNNDPLNDLSIHHESPILDYPSSAEDPPSEELLINNPFTTNPLKSNQSSVTNNQEEPELESHGKGVISERRTDARPKESKTGYSADPKILTKSEVRDTTYTENYENVESSRFVHSKQVEDKFGQSKSEVMKNRTPTPDQEIDHYQLPKPELNTMEKSETSYSGRTLPVKNYRLDSEQVTSSQHEDYYQQPNIEVRRNGAVEIMKSSYPNQIENPSRDSQLLRFEHNPTSQEATQESYYQQPTFDIRTLETPETNQSSPSNHNVDTDPNTKSKFTPNRSTEEASNLEQKEDYYENINYQTRKLKTAETTRQDEDYYQQPNFKAMTLKTVEINPNRQVGMYKKNSTSNPQQLAPEQDEGYYQQPNREVRKMEAQNRYPSRGETPQDEEYYQQPKFEEQRITAQAYPTEFETNTSLYEAPKDSTFSSAKCPLDQSVAQRNDKDYKKPLPEIPNERNTSESYYEMPMDHATRRCPLDGKTAETNERRENYEPVVEHIYEQPNFGAERVYERFNYEKMTSPTNLVNTNFYEIPKSEREVIYEQPDKKVYENMNGGVEYPHAKLGYESRTTSRPKAEKQPKAELSTPVHESLQTSLVNNDNTRENKNAGSTSYSVAKSPEHVDDLNLEYSENSGSRYKNLDTKQHSTSSLRSRNSGQSTRVTYTGEANTKKSIVSTTSSARIDQSDGRISEGSPYSRSTSFEGDLLQKPEVEVFKETPKRRTRQKARKTPDEEISQPSIYTSNTSLARFSSFNSEASYKRRLTSAWIEQQRMNFRKAVSREPSLRRTKSVEFHKERTPSEDTTEYKLRHAKSELNFEQLDGMYNPFDDKYFDMNTSKQSAKVVHTSPSRVITKAKSFEHRDQNDEKSKTLSQVNTPTKASKDSLIITPFEKNDKQTHLGNREQNLAIDGNISRQDGVVRRSEIREWRDPSLSSQQFRPKSEVDLNNDPNSDEHNILPRNKYDSSTMPAREVKPRSRVRPKSADVSGFDITSNEMEENVHKQDDVRNKAITSTSQQKPLRVRPKSADVSGFDITSYDDGARDVSMEENMHKQDHRILRSNAVKATLNQRVRPKSADVSGFDITTYNDEPTLKQSKSELSVNQLKAMYDPYDENSWFSPEPASQNVSQSNSRQVEVTVHDAIHQRTRSEPESRADRFKSGEKMKQSEPEIRKGELGSLEAEPKNITKLNSSSVLLLNVVEVGENSKSRNPKLKRSAVSKSLPKENEKSLTMLETKDTRRESTRNVKPNGDNTVDGRTTEKPIEIHRARYIIGGQRASVKYLSKSTDKLTLSDNDAMKKETQERPDAKPEKSSKKDFGIRNFFGKMRRTKSEPNLDKNFDILDIDSDHGGKKKNSQKDEKYFNETSPNESQDKLQHTSKSGLKASSFYPKLKNFKKNFVKSKQSKTDDSFNDSGKDISKNEEFPESSDFSEKHIKRENVELTESQDFVRPQNIESKPVDSLGSVQSINPTKSNQSYTSQSERPQFFVQIEQPSSSKSQNTSTTSPKSPVMSPRSARKRFFQGGNRVGPVIVTVNDSEEYHPGKEKTSTNVVVHENRGEEGRIKTDKSDEKNGRIASSSPVTSTDKLPDRFEKVGPRRMYETTVKSASPRFQSEPQSYDDKERFPLREEPQERTTSYRVSEVSSRNGKSGGDERTSSFEDSFTRHFTVALATNTATIDKNRTTYSISNTNFTKKSDAEENKSAGLNTQMNLQANGQRNSLHDESFIVNTEAKDKDTRYNGLTVEINSTNTDLDPKHEELNTKDSEESENVIPKTKHRSFFSTKIFTSVGKSNSSQNKHKLEKNESKEFWRESEHARGTKDTTTTVDVREDIVKVRKDIVLETSNQALKDDGNEATSKKSNNKETMKSDAVLNEGKKTKISGQTSREEKSEFGTKIKGFITKVLPQKDKSSSKDNAVKEETVSGKTKVDELERSPDQNNNATGIVSVTAKDTLSDSTKSRRSISVVKHLGESDSERTRTSDEERKQVRSGTIELDSSNERGSRYISKVKHIGDSKTVKTGSLEKLSEKQSRNKRFTTLGNNDSYTTQRNVENRNGKMNATSSFGSTAGSNAVQDETITKTEVLDNVESFDSVLDFFEKAFNDEECQDGNEEKLETPEELGKLESSMMVSNSTIIPGKKFGTANNGENNRHENHFAKDTKQDFVINDWGERVSTTEVNLRKSDAKRQNMQNRSHTMGYVKESDGNRSLEEIKGFTIKHTKTSSLVLTKSMEDHLDTVGEDDDNGDRKIEKKHEEINTKQDYSRNAKTKLAESSTLVDNEAEYDKPSNHDDDVNKEKQLKYIEKVMVSVRRGASDVKKVVEEFNETPNVESGELYSPPMSKSFEHARMSSGDDRNLKVLYTRAADEVNSAHSSLKMGFGNSITSVQSSSSVSKLFEHGRSSSGEGNDEMVFTHDTEDARFARLSSNGGKGVTKQDKTRSLNVGEGWGHVIEEFVVKNKEETTNALNDNGDELIQLLEEQISSGNSPKQPQDTSTPIQDDNTRNSSRGDLTSSQFNSTGSRTLIHTTSKSVVDGPRLSKSLDVEESKTFGFPKNKSMSTTQSPSSTSNSLVKTIEMKSTPLQPSSTKQLQIKNQTTTSSSNFEEQQTVSSTRSVTSLKQQNETLVSSKLSRPKSLMNKETKVSTLHSKAGESSVSSEKRRSDPKNEMAAGNVIPKKRPKQTPPPVQPKPKRNKAKDISQVKIGDDEKQQRKPVGFLDVQNNNLSFVNFQSFEGNYQGEQKMFHSTQNYHQTGGISRESFASGRVISTERKELSSSVTTKQFKNERMASSSIPKADETFKHLKSRESDTVRRNDSNKEKTSNNGKQRKNRGTTVSETSEDLSVRLQRLLCEDDSMSEPEDSSVTHEVASTIYSEDSEFDTNLMARRYKSLEKQGKTSEKIPKSSHVSMDDSSDEEIFKNNTKLSYRMCSKTL